MPAASMASTGEVPQPMNSWLTPLGADGGEWGERRGGTGSGAVVGAGAEAPARGWQAAARCRPRQAGSAVHRQPGSKPCKCSRCSRSHLT